jgi:hypothetical protein
MDVLVIQTKIPEIQTIYIFLQSRKSKQKRIEIFVWISVIFLNFRSISGILIFNFFCLDSQFALVKMMKNFFYLQALSSTLIWQV